MTVIVDENVCIGCGMCCQICPEVFAMNDQGKAEVYRYDDSADHAAAQEALDSCPVTAIGWQG